MTISGNVVARLTIVAPIKILGKENLFAMWVAELPSQSAPKITAVIEITKTMASGINYILHDFRLG